MVIARSSPALVSWSRVERSTFFFFFQAEDGIRDLIVTGVQTCALPICAWRSGGCRRPRGSAQRTRAPSATRSSATERRPNSPHYQHGDVARDFGPVAELGVLVRAPAVDRAGGRESARVPVPGAHRPEHEATGHRGGRHAAGHRPQALRTPNVPSPSLPAAILPQPYRLPGAG